jgi:protein SCO1/2
MISRAGLNLQFLIFMLAACLFSTALAAHSSDHAPKPGNYYPSLPMHTDFGGPFKLKDHLGNTFTQNDLKGHFSLLYFGYTNCPDICSIALHTIQVALDEVGAPDGVVVPYLVNLDPQRDSLVDLSEYVGFFHRDLVGLTGTDEEIRVIAGAYSVRYKNVSDDDGELKTVHSGMIFLLDPTGKAVAMLPHEVPADWLAATLRDHLPEF